MKINEGKTDRIIRVIVGIVLLALSLFGVVGGWLMWASYVVGAVLVLTGIVGFCPLYAVLKFSTARK